MRKILHLSSQLSKSMARVQLRVCLSLHDHTLLRRLSHTFAELVNAEPQSAPVCKPVVNAILTCVAAVCAFLLNLYERKAVCKHGFSCSQTLVASVEIALYRFAAIFVPPSRFSLD